MEAQQCVKLSLTNRSIGLIPPVPLKGREKKRKPSRPAISSDVPPKAERRPSDRRLRKQASRAQPLCQSKAAVIPTADPPKAERRKGLPQSLRAARQTSMAALSKDKAAQDPAHRRFARAKRLMCLDDLVAMARGQTPDPIPNSAVKTLSADGTAS